MLTHSASLLVFLSLAPFASGQSTQVGGLIGWGGVSQLFENSAYHAVAGVESCFLCGGRLGLFTEYHHWQKIGKGTDQPVSLDVVCGGLRIQGKGARIRPFLDLGFLGGAEEKDRPILPFNNTRQGIVGGVLGFGAAFSITDHWYVRPLGRIIGLSSSEYGGFAGVAVGYRF